MYEDLKGKIALVSGSGKKTGIGYAIAKKFAQNGANVIITDLGQPPADDGNVRTATQDEMSQIAAELAQECDVKTLAVELDVSDRESVARMAEKVKAEFGRVDILVNNAGASFGVPADLGHYNPDAWLKTLNVNLNGVLWMCQAMLPLMTQGGAIINTASRAGKVPPLFNGGYAVAKAGVIMMTKVMAKEVAGQNIRVNAICPGQIMTDLEKWRFGLEAKFLGTTIEQQAEEMCKTIPLNRIGSTDEVASLVAFLASAESSYMTGQAINITGGQLMEL